ncbi:GNAT family N-acetyltransferase [Jeotgalibacillus haloalkalitolerans]|uniref:GNAT family N-acetyltransferase n=1 Tax=Jeotgalibacillus haloalkalitolerans TaxID=3104292 RepID=A0ABU5KPW0_9BACL|nr:GNAT family N-acetyltransferase [Jeotgalibacillus sp. HH7-29]MDZ5713287.1 GNAT family N-acetyltransferase [Jeotgalibacillus sp. HH7-29]
MKSLIRLVKAEASMVKELTALSSEVFSREAARWLTAGEEDANIQPPGYDSEDMMTYMITYLDTYGIYNDGTLIGGAVLTLPASGYARIDRIFIAPELQGKGFGKEAIRQIEKSYPEVTRWQLETSPKQIGNRYFYESVGYECVWETEELMFEKKLLASVEPENTRRQDQDYTSAELISVQARGVKVTDANIRSLHISNAAMQQTKMQNVNLSDSLVADSTVQNATFWFADLSSSVFRTSDMSGVALENCNIAGMTIDGISVEELMKVYKKGK